MVGPVSNLLATFSNWISLGPAPSADPVGVEPFGLNSIGALSSVIEQQCVLTRFLGKRPKQNLVSSNPDGPCFFEALEHQIVH